EHDRLRGGVGGQGHERGDDPPADRVLVLLGDAVLAGLLAEGGLAGVEVGRVGGHSRLRTKVSGILRIVGPGPPAAATNLRAGRCVWYTEYRSERLHRLFREVSREAEPTPARLRGDDDGLAGAGPEAVAGPVPVPGDVPQPDARRAGVRDDLGGVRRAAAVPDRAGAGGVRSAAVALLVRRRGVPRGGRPRARLQARP